jgi:hypothetical protein
MGQVRPPIIFDAFDLLGLNGKPSRFADRRTNGEADIHLTEEK